MELAVWVLLSLVGFFVICGVQCSCYGLWSVTCLGCLLAVFGFVYWYYLLRFLYE